MSGSAPNNSAVNFQAGVFTYTATSENDGTTDVVIATTTVEGLDSATRTISNRSTLMDRRTTVPPSRWSGGALPPSAPVRLPESGPDTGHRALPASGGECRDDRPLRHARAKGVYPPRRAPRRRSKTAHCAGTVAVPRRARPSPPGGTDDQDQKAGGDRIAGRRTMPVAGRRRGGVERAGMSSSPLGRTSTP